MEEKKNKYNKKVTQKRITIKYYLNNKLKPKISDSGEELYPLYFQLLIKGKNTLNKSRVNEEYSKYPFDTFKKIENIINSELQINFINFMEFMRFVRSAFNNEMSLLKNKEELLLFLILREKMLINKICKDLRPFERNEFNINEFNDKFDIYNYKLKDSIPKLLRELIKRALLQETVIESDSNNAQSLLDLINWTDANAYHLCIFLKDRHPRINNLFEMFPYSFQIISDVDLKIIPEEMNFLIESFANATYVDCYLETLSFVDDYNKKRMLLGDSDNLVDSIHRELQSLF